ncbi:DNA helicase [Malassezia psittaci]|uniref:DNA helicase n=1 Tax=Malassezia psittaci TaxID=1821823 RepID=A0AAF0F7Q1_9BASI|nr:DNA helicase [Malassezia psittaci]
MKSVRTPIPPDAEHIQKWIERQRELIDLERNEEREQNALLVSKCAPRFLERNGLALLGLYASSIRIGQGAKLLVDLERSNAIHSSSQFPPHTFRPGDVVEIRESKSTKKGAELPKGDRGVVFRVKETQVTIALDGAGKGSDEDKPVEYDLAPVLQLVKLANEVTYDRMDKSMTALMRNLGLEKGQELASLSQPVIRCLFGLSPPTWSNSVSEISWVNPNFNKAQQSAIEFALRSDQLALIHGPPGTGKTTVIAEFVLQLVRRNPKTRVLVCGASNLAVDNLLERVLFTPGYKEVLQATDSLVTRIGHPARIMDSLTNATLDVQTTMSSEGQLVRDIAKEIDEIMSMLSSSKSAARAGNKSARNAQRPKGAERRKLWEQVRELRKEYRKREQSLTTNVLQRARIVMATCHGAGSRQLQSTEFDYVIIDEACQAVEPTCWTAILKLAQHGKLILAGDHLQLPPTVKAKKSLDVVGDRAGLHLPSSLETTLFDRLLDMYGDGCKVLLSTQYRMCEEIMAFPNEAMYESRLKAADSCRAIRLYDLDSVDKPTEEDDELWSAPLVFYDTTGSGMLEKMADDEPNGSLLQATSRCNENEVTLVERHIRILIEHGVPVSDIAVLSPYASQIDLLSTHLRHSYGTMMEVGTIDGMQGREKEVVIVSLVRSNEEFEIGFLCERRRLNVAMTRAKRQLVIVGDAETLQGKSQDKTEARNYLRAWIDSLHTNAVVEMSSV